MPGGTLALRRARRAPRVPPLRCRSAAGAGGGASRTGRSRGPLRRPGRSRPGLAAASRVTRAGMTGRRSSPSRCCQRRAGVGAARGLRPAAGRVRSTPKMTGRSPAYARVRGERRGQVTKCHRDRIRARDVERDETCVLADHHRLLEPELAHDVSLARLDLRDRAAARHTDAEPDGVRAANRVARLHRLKGQAEAHQYVIEPPAEGAQLVRRAAQSALDPAISPRPRHFCLGECACSSAGPLVPASSARSSSGSELLLRAGAQARTGVTPGVAAFAFGASLAAAPDAPHGRHLRAASAVYGPRLGWGREPAGASLAGRELACQGLALQERGDRRAARFGSARCRFRRPWRRVAQRAILERRLDTYVVAAKSSPIRGGRMRSRS